MVSTTALRIKSELKVANVKHDELVDAFRTAVEDAVASQASWKKWIPGYVQRNDEAVATTRNRIRRTQSRIRSLEKRASTLKRIAIHEAEASLRSATADLFALHEVDNNLSTVSISHCLERGLLSREELWTELWGASVGATPAEDKVLQKLVVSKPKVMMGLLKRLIARQRVVVRGRKENVRKLVEGSQ